LPDIWSFLTGRGITIREDNIVRASEPEPPGEQRKVNRRLPIIGETIETIAKAFFDYLSDRGVEFEFKSEDETIEVIKQDSPDKIVKFVQRHKDTIISLKIKP
jgi:hypothetical protein